MEFPFVQTRDLLEDAIAKKITSGIGCYGWCGDLEGTLFLGHSAYPEAKAHISAIDEDSIWDLASLTKIFSGLALVITAIQEDKLRLNEPVSSYLPEFPVKDALVHNLLDHNAGLEWHLPFFEMYKREGAMMGVQSHVLDWICETPPRAPVGKETVYSDLDLLLIGFTLERIYGKPICDIFHEKVVEPLGLVNTGYRRLPHISVQARHFLKAEQSRFVATEHCPWREKVLQGEVHDDNTWAMGGYAAHAGLFSTLSESKKMFMHVLELARSTDGFWPELPPPRKFSFATGFMFFPGLVVQKESFFKGAIGHTGFTGTSAFYHPESGEFFLLFSNRVHPTRDNPHWHPRRVECHKAFWQDCRRR